MSTFIHDQSAPIGNNAPARWYIRSLRLTGVRLPRQSQWYILWLVTVLGSLVPLVSNAQYIKSSTYLGGSAGEAPATMQVVNGITYTLGSTSSANYPVTNGSTFKGGTDLVYTKMDAAGNILFATYLGGSGNDNPTNMQVVDGEAYIFGFTDSPNYPVTNGSAFKGGYDFVVTKLDAAGNILFSTYLGEAIMIMQEVCKSSMVKSIFRALQLQPITLPPMGVNSRGRHREIGFTRSWVRLAIFSSRPTCFH